MTDKEINDCVKKVIAMFPAKVKEYKEGKTGLIGMFVGEAMIVSRGHADPKVLNQMVKKELDESTIA